MVDQPPATIPDKLQPHNVEAEEAVLGSLLIDPDAIIRIANFLTPEDFFVERHGWVYDVVRDLHEKKMPADLVTVTDELERRKQLSEVGGSAFLTGLINATPTSVHVEYYGRIVERTGILRRLIEASGMIARLAYEDSDELAAVLDEAASIMMPVLSVARGKGIVQIGQPLDALLDFINMRQENPNALLGIPTGLKDLDKLLHGLRRGTFYILAARPGMGKSSLAHDIALYAALGRKSGRQMQVHQKRNVGIITLEMSDEEVTTKLLANISGIDSRRIQSGDIKESEWASFLAATDLLSKLGIYIYDISAPSIHEVRNQAMQMVHQFDVDLLIVDYLQLMRGSGRKNQNREQEISEISRGLKALAKELNVPILALSQLNRELEKRSDKRPMLADLRESGSLEQDADVVLFIYRDEMYNPETEFPNIAEILVSKHRMGPTGIFSVYFKKHLSQFVDLEVHQQPLEY